MRTAGSMRSRAVQNGAYSAWNSSKLYSTFVMSGLIGFESSPKMHILSMISSIVAA